MVFVSESLVIEPDIYLHSGHYVVLVPQRQWTKQACNFPFSSLWYPVVILPRDRVKVLVHHPTHTQTLGSVGPKMAQSWANVGPTRVR